MNWRMRFGGSWGRLGMKSSWKTMKLSEFVEFNPKESIKKGTVAKKIPMENIKPFCRDVWEYSKEAFSGGAKFRNGDTIMARITPCLENGKIAKVSVLDKDEIGFGSTEYIVFRAKKGISDENYVYYLICSSAVKDSAIKSMVGSSGRQRVQINVLENLEIIVPPLIEQQKIGAFLKMLDDKIALNNRINDNLLQQVQALYKSWFVDYEPFNGIKPLDWTVGTVDDLAKEIVCGKTPSTKVAEYYGSDIPFITIPDMHGNTYAVTTERYLSTYGANSQAKKTLPKNSVCVSCIGTVGLVVLVTSESQTNQQINSIIPKDDYSPFYIYLLMQTLSEVISKLGQSGSTIVNLNKTQFGKIRVTVPSVTSMKAFDDLVSPSFALILENQKENNKLASLREELLPKLVSGKLDVSTLDL